MKATAIKLLLSTDIAFVSVFVPLSHPDPQYIALYRQCRTLQPLECRHA